VRSDTVERCTAAALIWIKTRQYANDDASHRRAAICGTWRLSQINARRDFAWDAEKSSNGLIPIGNKGVTNEEEA
jgi:hypothetical protein